MIIVSKITKGRLIEIGLLGNKHDTKKGIFLVYLLYAGLALLCLLLIYQAYMGQASIGGSSQLAFVMPFFPFIAIVSIILFMNGMEIDGVYENGFTHRRVGLIKKIQGKHWIPWNEVDKIFYGKFDFEDERGVSEYLRIVSGNKDSRFFIKAKYDKHNPRFYILLMKTLKEKSLQAKWIKKDE